MTHKEIITKLIGPIKPVGKSEVDEERFENLKAVCSLVESLISDIDKVAYECKNSYEFSVKRSGEFAKEFLTERLGITEYHRR